MVELVEEELSVLSPPAAMAEEDEFLVLTKTSGW